MVSPRILAGLLALDKLPWWIAAPAGIITGGAAGYWLINNPHGLVAPFLMLVALGTALVLGWAAPRSEPPEPPSQAMPDDAAIL